MVSNNAYKAGTRFQVLGFMVIDNKDGLLAVGG
jgi:hypothetical protein